MSNRLTKKWTRTASEAFGESGTKGRRGEEFVIELLRAKSFEVHDHESDRHSQVSGIDITFRETAASNNTSIDVKHNITPSYSFFVETEAKGWLARSKADYIYHVNVDKKVIAKYKVNDMRAYVQAANNIGTPLHRIDHLDSPTFVKWEFNAKR